MLSNIEEKDTNVLNNQEQYIGKDNRIQLGFIRSNIEDKYTIESTGKKVVGTQALSCLINPRVNDYVAFIDTGERAFIISILERGDLKEALHMKSEAPIEISAPAIKLFGEETIDIAGGNAHLAGINLAVTAEALQVTADTGEARINSLTHMGKSLKIVLTDILLRAAASLRVIDGSDYQKAKQINISADGYLSLKGDLASIVAKKDVKVDAERVHIG